MASKNSGPVPLAGGARLGIGTMVNQIEGGIERVMNAKLNSENGANKSQIEATPAENSSANKQDLPEEESYQNVLDKLVNQDTASVRKQDNPKDYPNHLSRATNKDESENKAFDPYGEEESDNDVDIP